MEEEKNTLRAFGSRAKNSVEKQKVLILSFKDYSNISNFEIFFSPFLLFHVGDKTSHHGFQVVIYFFSLGWQEKWILSEEQLLVLYSALKWRAAVIGKWRVPMAKPARVWPLGANRIPWTQNGCLLWVCIGPLSKIKLALKIFHTFTYLNGYQIQVDRVVNSLRVPTTNAQCNTSWQNPIHLLWTHGNNKIDFFNELILSVEPTRVSFSITYKANKTELKVTFILKMKCDLVLSEIEVFSLSN